MSVISRATGADRNRLGGSLARAQASAPAAHTEVGRADGGDYALAGRVSGRRRKTTSGTALQNKA